MTLYDFENALDDIDDAEHPGYCQCPECDPDAQMDRMREERLIEEAS